MVKEDNDTYIARHGFATGLVQGVFFRQQTQREAQRLGLSGWVRNLSDGRVEYLAYGPRSRVESLIVWLRQGPPSARVEDLTAEDSSEIPNPGFVIAE